MQGGGLSILGDRAIAKSEETNCEDTTKLGDRPITPLEAKPETFTKSDIQETERGDRGGRSEGDQTVEIEEQSTAPQRTESAIEQIDPSAHRGIVSMAEKKSFDVPVSSDVMLKFIGEKAITSSIYARGKLRVEAIVSGATVVAVNEIFHSDQSQVYVRPIASEWDSNTGIAVPKSSLEFMNPITIASIVIFKERTDGRSGLFRVQKVEGL